MSVAVLAPERRGALVGRLPAVTPTEDLDVVLEHIAPGEVLFSAETSREGQPSVVTHGRMCTTLLELALSAAVQSLLSPGQSYRPLELAVSVVPEGRLVGGRLEASARVVRSGGGLLVATGSVRGARDLRATGRLAALTLP